MDPSTFPWLCVVETCYLRLEVSRQRLHVGASAIRFEVVKPLLPVRLGHGRGIDVAVSRTTSYWRAIPGTGNEIGHFCGVECPIPC